MRGLDKISVFQRREKMRNWFSRTVLSLTALSHLFMLSVWRVVRSLAKCRLLVKDGNFIVVSFESLDLRFNGS